MQAVRIHHLNQLEDKIYKPISDLNEAANGSMNFCLLAQRKVMRYTMGLCTLKEGMSRFSDGLVAMSTIWDGLKVLAKEIHEIEKTTCLDCNKLCAVPMAEPMLRALEGIRHEVGGLCLRCESEGNSPMEACEHTIPM